MVLPGHYHLQQNSTKLEFFWWNRVGEIQGSVLNKNFKKNYFWSSSNITFWFFLVIFWLFVVFFWWFSGYFFCALFPSHFCMVFFFWLSGYFLVLWSGFLIGMDFIKKKKGCVNSHFEERLAFLFPFRIQKDSGSSSFTHPSTQHQAFNLLFFFFFFFFSYFFFHLVLSQNQSQ